MISGLRLRMNCIRLSPFVPIYSPSLETYRHRRRSKLFSTTSCTAERKKVLVISGPTGAGKSRLALELAKRLNGEIISADSVQVYRGLDIGSAKPSVQERQEVPHHLVDILQPYEDYSAGKFYEDARNLTEEVLSRGRVPIITGGTGLYLRWFIYGKPDVPKASAEITLEVNTELGDLQRYGDWNAAVELVVKAGDPGALSLASNDWYRLRRRLEILKSSGASTSAFQIPYDTFKDKVELSEVDASGTISETAETQENGPKDLDYNFLCYFLTTRRLSLYRSIDLRCEDMLLDDGILSEANWLLDMGLEPNTNSATKAIGYRQAMDYLLFSREQGGWSSSNGFYRFLADFQKSSRNFAKRQLTWFRNEPIYEWIDASKPMENVLDFICDAYNYQGGELKVPQSLCMDKDASNKMEIRELKAYRAKNRHFIREEDCYSILDWVRKLKGRPNYQHASHLLKIH